MTENVKPRKSHARTLLLLVYIVICSAVLKLTGPYWRGEDISIAYAIFASVGIPIVVVSVSLFAGILGGWILKLLTKSDWFLLHDRSASSLARELVAVLLGFSIAASALLLFRGTSVSRDPYETEWLSDPFPQ